MRLKLIIIAVGILLIAGGSFWLHAASPGQVALRPPPPPSTSPNAITASAAAPAVIDVLLPQMVKITATIAGPSLIKNSVNLLRLNANGTSSVLGQLKDDGTSGDTTANDGIFSAQVSFNEPTTGSVRLQVSAAFQGQLKRVLSPRIIVSVVPPDPGSAGRATLAGIDSDHDGVRDDVQRWIAFSQPTSARTRAALWTMALNMQAELQNLTNTSAVIAASHELGRSVDCLDYVRPTEADTALDSMQKLVYNTEARLEALFAINDILAGEIYPLTPPANRKQACAFDVDALEN